MHDNLTAPPPHGNDPDEAGFTLIEVLVVVMIIGILIAIAVPTLLGARGRAQQRAAQADVRTGYSAARTAFSDAQSYNNATYLGTGATLVTNMSSIEPSITWTTASSTGKRIVSIWAGAGTGPAGALGLAELSGDNRCYQLWDDPDSAAPPVYLSQAIVGAATCTAPQAKPTAGTPWAT